MYPGEWRGSSDPSDESGIATFKIDGLEFVIEMGCFSDFKTVLDMLERSFIQGKRFAGNVMRSHIHNAIEQARQTHAL